LSIWKILGLSQQAASLASKAVMYGFVDQCEADEINRVMVDTCTSRFPGLSKEADVVLAAWRVSASDLEAARRRTTRDSLE
jgi:hypothetical protein